MKLINHNIFQYKILTSKRLKNKSETENFFWKEL